MRNELSEADLLYSIIQKRTATIRTSTIAKVTSYDPANQTVTAQPCFRIAHEKSRTGLVAYRDAAPLINVPVLFPQASSASMALTMALSPGDYVFISFAERSIDEWRASGGERIEPSDLRRHSAADAVAHPVISPLGGISGAATEGMKIGQHTGTNDTCLDFNESGKVSLGNDTADVVAILDDLIAALQSAFTATLGGPQPLDPATQVLFTNMRTLLATIKK